MLIGMVLENLIVLRIRECSFESLLRLSGIGWVVVSEVGVGFRLRFRM